MSDSKRVAREPMSKVDTAWLRMESPTNLMMITGVMIFHERLDVKKIKGLLAKQIGRAHV